MPPAKYFIEAVILGLLTIVLPACANGPQANPLPNKRVPNLLKAVNAQSSDYIIIVAHRACWQNAPENSIAAIEDCITANVDMVELDVRQTSDGVLVILHDETLDRTTSGSGKIESITYDQVRKFPLKQGKGGPDENIDPRQLYIPTLEEGLLAAKGKVLVNIDAKSGLYDSIFKVVETTNTGDQVVMKMRASADDPKLQNALFHGRALFMPVIVQCGVTAGDTRFCADDLEQVYDDYLRYNPIAFEIVYKDKDFLWNAMSPMKEDGRVWVNTLHPEISAGMSNAAALENPESVWGTLVDNGVNMIQTDNPLELITFLEETNRRGRFPGERKTQN